MRVIEGLGTRRMTTSIGAPRILLRRLREIMAAPISAQERLDKTVALIAGNMVAEVSSLYVRRADGSLELFATHGLNPKAVHRTRLPRGEGLVGRIAEQLEPLNLTDASAHPAFSYRPETGEEIYHAFLGVPILRGGHAIGVLTVQNKVRRRYSDEEVEALQTTAMVLAELLASRDFEGLGEDTDITHTRPHTIQGIPLQPGIALGHIVLHEPRVPVTRLIADNPQQERERLHLALSALREKIDRLLARSDVAGAGEHRDVLEAYRMFAQDRGWIRRMEEAIATGLTAEAAVERVQSDSRARMMRQTNPFFRERLHDLADLSNRLLRELSGHPNTAASEELPKDAILVARTMGPAELLDYDRERLRGLVLEEAGVASHVAVVARALGLAAVGGAEDILSLVEPGDEVVVDGESGEVHVRPGQDVIEAYRDKVRFQAKRAARYHALRHKPAVTRDGVKISLMVNLGLEANLPHLAQSGAEGIGLFRTELQFMVSPAFPKREQQTDMYRSVLAAADGRPVVFRTLDIGGDKMLPYLRHDHEENPALGWRAIRIGLDRPGVFRTQIRAFLRAAEGRELRILIPMISDVSEFVAARELIAKEQAQVEDQDRPAPSRVLVGAMLEVPALLWQLDQLLPKVDFLSVGSNDLLQFLFAADRANLRVAHRFDSLNPTFLKVLQDIRKAAERHNVPVTLCGEMAGHPVEAMALLALGYRTLSMAPAAIGPVKAMIRSLDCGAFTDWFLPQLDHETQSLRSAIETWAESAGVDI